MPPTKRTVFGDGPGAKVLLDGVTARYSCLLLEDLSRRVLPREVEADIVIGGDDLESDIHERDEVQPAEFARE